MIRITTTRQRDLQPLGAAGQTATEAWNVLAALLTRELSPAHAALFAEPVEHPARGETDWYTESTGAPVPLPLVDPAVRAAVLTERARLEQDVRALAARRRTAAGEPERFLGEMLRLALSIPGEDCIYVVDGRPVLVAWGHAPAGGLPEQVAVKGLRAGAPVPMPILPPPPLPAGPVRTGRWLAAALIAACVMPLLALLLLFLDPLGWYAVAGPQCRISEGQPALLASLREAADREAQLRSQLAQLADDAGRRHLQCPPIRVPAPPVSPAATTRTAPSSSQDVQRATDQGGHGGKLQIVLAWEDRSDLDLVVRCPSGEAIYFDQRSACGGHLDVDANFNPATATTTPVENVYFDHPAAGTYHIIVRAWELRAGPQSAFRVTVRREGQADQVIEDSIRQEKQNQTVTDVVVPPE